jgi:ATP-dependent DNA helicase PIF1
LKLKVGAPVILLRNLDPSAGLCNGTRMRVERCGEKVVECRFWEANMLEKPYSFLEFLSPPSSAELPFEFHRTQFPLRLAFAMTINKSQGQTFTHVGLVLNDPVFTHGQHYPVLPMVLICISLFQRKKENSKMWFIERCLDRNLQYKGYRKCCE